MRRNEAPLNPGTPLALADFDDLHDVEFVQQAYRQLLLRDPDPSGESHYLSRVRAGVSKNEILIALMQSSEGKAVNRKIDGAMSYSIVRFIAHIPIIGNIFEAFIFIYHIRQFMKEVRSLENYVYQLKMHVDRLSNDDR